MLSALFWAFMSIVTVRVRLAPVPVQAKINGYGVMTVTQLAETAEAATDPPAVRPVYDAVDAPVKVQPPVLVSVPVVLGAGVQQMTLRFDTAGLNIASVTIVSASPPVPPPGHTVTVREGDSLQSAT